MTLTYQLGDKLYLNITNRCTCACTFCIRNFGDGVGDGENLRLDRDATAAEVIEDLKKRELSKYSEIVFCGYGEPTENLETMLEVCKYLKSVTTVPLRLNTNGLASLSHGNPVPPVLNGLIDIISISLNAPDAERYLELTNAVFGISAFDALLDFAEECKKHINDVHFSVVDILPPEEIEGCERIAEEIGIPLRIRSKI